MPEKYYNDVELDKKRELVIQANAKGYTFKGNVPAAACLKCGGWSYNGGMSSCRRTPEPVMGRYGCLCNDGVRYLKSIVIK